MERWDELIEALFESWDREINDQGTLRGIKEKNADAKAEAGRDDYTANGKGPVRGISSGVTTSTTIASGRGAWNGLALTRSSPTIRAPKWPMAETASPGRIYRFNPIIHGVNRYRPAALAAYIILADQYPVFLFLLGKRKCRHHRA
jgi:hypothetical protein